MEFQFVISKTLEVHFILTHKIWSWTITWGRPRDLRPKWSSKRTPATGQVVEVQQYFCWSTLAQPLIFHYRFDDCSKTVSSSPVSKSKYIYSDSLNLFFVFAIPFSLNFFYFCLFLLVIFKHCINIIIRWRYRCWWLLLQWCSTRKARLVFYSAPFSCLKINIKCKNRVANPTKNYLVVLAGTKFEW